jgi:hypothetical protein
MYRARLKHTHLALTAAFVRVRVAQVRGDAARDARGARVACGRRRGERADRQRGGGLNDGTKRSAAQSAGQDGRGVMNELLRGMYCTAAVMVTPHLHVRLRVRLRLARG